MLACFTYSILQKMDRTVLDNYTSLFLNRKGQISGYYEIFISTVNDILNSELF